MDKGNPEKFELSKVRKLALLSIKGAVKLTNHAAMGGIYITIKTNGSQLVSILSIVSYYVRSKEMKKSKAVAILDQ